MPSETSRQAVCGPAPDVEVWAGYDASEVR